MKLRDIFSPESLSLRRQRLLLLVVLLITFAVYAPSLFQTARSDQLVYLADVANNDGLVSIVSHTYSLDRTREFYLGNDYLLFRPVLYGLLGFEKWAFGYGFFWWQLTSLLLHLCVVWLLLKILYLKGRTIFAPLFALLFSVQYVAMNMVIWHHLSGYLLFSVFLLSSIYNLLKYEETGSPGNGIALSLFLLLAAFTYEAGSAAALLIALYMTLSRLNKRSRYGWRVIAATCMVPVIYVSLSLIDLYAKFGNLSAIGQAAPSNLPSAILHTAGASLFWLAAGLDPALIHMKAYERLLMTINSSLSATVIVGTVPACIFLSSSYFIARETFSREYVRKNAGFVCLVLLIMLSHAAIIVIGRVSERGFWTIMTLNPYYTYISNLLAFLALYSAMDLEGPRLRARVMPRAGIAISIILITAMSAVSISKANMEMLDYSRPRNRFVARLSELVQKHSGEEGFSFSVSGNCRGINIWKEADRFDSGDLRLSPDRPGNDILWLTRRGDPPGKTYTLAEALFPRWYVKSGGKYEVSCPPRQ